jgi:hypothetical protein
MKKLNELQINTEKILKGEELINLKGGTWCGACIVVCEGVYLSGPGCGTSQGSAIDTLASLYSWCQGGPLVGCGDQIV